MKRKFVQVAPNGFDRLHARIGFPFALCALDVLGNTTSGEPCRLFGHD